MSDIKGSPRSFEKGSTKIEDIDSRCIKINETTCREKENKSSSNCPVTKHPMFQNLQNSHIQHEVDLC